MVQGEDASRLTRVKPPEVGKLPDKPEQKGPLTDIKHATLSMNIDWLLKAVQALDGGCQKMTTHVKDAVDVQALLKEKLKAVEDGVKLCMKRIDEIPPPAPPPPPPEPVIIEPERDEVLGLLDEDNTGNVKRKKLFDFFYQMGFAKQAEVEALVKSEVEALRQEHDKQLQEHAAEIKKLHGDMKLRLLISTFEEYKKQIQTRLKNMDDLHEEDVKIREEMQAEHQALAARHEQLQQDVLDLEARHAKRLDDCEEFERELERRIADFRLRLDEHDEQFELMEQLRQKQAQKRVGPVTVDSFSHVAMEEEIRRLRSMVECMEQALGADVQKTMEFFKHAERTDEARGGGGAGASSPATAAGTKGAAAGGGTVSNATVTQLHDELTEMVQQCREIVIRDQEKMFTALGTMQRDSELLDAKVEDLWKRLPKVVALLEPLKLDVSGSTAKATNLDATSLQTTAAGAERGALDGRSEIQALTSFLQASLQGSVDELKESVELTVARLREDLQQTTTEAKAEMVSLSGRFDSFNEHVATRRQKSSTAMMKDMSSLSPAAAETATATTAKAEPSGPNMFDRCKVPTEPAAATQWQKEGRLPKGVGVTGSAVT